MAADAEARNPSGRAFWVMGSALVGLAVGLQAYAIWANEYLPLVDLPNHMARHYLEAVHLAGGDIGPFYALEFRLVPNLGADLILPFLILAFGPHAACKLFLTAAVFLYWLGPAWFVAQQGGYRRPALVAALLLLPFSFTGQFYWGFLNFYSGFGLAFLLLVHLGWLMRQVVPRPGQYLLHVALVTLLFLWHLAPWTIYGAIASCLVAADALGRYRQNPGRRAAILRRGAGCLAPLVPAFLLLVGYSLGNAVGVNPAAGYTWGGVPRKLLLPGSLFRGYDFRVDVAVALLWAGGIVIMFGTSLVRGWRWSPLQLCLAGLVAFFIVMPFRLGGTLDADGRVVPALLVCAVGILGSLSVTRVRAGAVLLGLCVVLRYGSVAYSWNEFGKEMQTHAGGLAALEPQCRVMPVVIIPEHSKVYPETHFVSWALLSKNVLVPTLFAFHDQQPLRITAPHRLLVRRTAEAVDVSEGVIAEGYDYLWVYNPAGKTVRVPEAFERVFAATSVSLWRLRSSEGVAARTAP